ncbi:hypothetical protein LLG95_12865, partial [bacterium]|nr:hypothetical protein [bacterium]
LVFLTRFYGLPLVSGVLRATAFCAARFSGLNGLPPASAGGQRSIGFLVSALQRAFRARLQPSNCRNFFVPFVT